MKQLICFINNELKTANLPYSLHIFETINDNHCIVDIISTINHEKSYTQLQIEYLDAIDCISIYNNTKSFYFTGHLVEGDILKFIDLLSYQIDIIENAYIVLSKIYNIIMWNNISIITPKYEKIGYVYEINYNMNGRFTLFKLDYDTNNTKYHPSHIQVGDYKDITEIKNIISNEHPNLQVKSFLSRCLEYIPYNKFSNLFHYFD